MNNDLRSEIEAIVGAHFVASSPAFTQAVDTLEARITAAGDAARVTEVERQVRSLNFEKVVLAASGPKPRKRRAKATEVEAKPTLPVPPPPLPPFTAGGSQ